MMPHPSLFVTIIGFLLLLGPLVLLHELGHYSVARIFGVKAEVFSIGFGRELAGLTDRRGTRWKLSLIPLGGYVQFAGDMNAMSMPADELLAVSAAEREHSFHFKPLWQRALIVGAGPMANFLVAMVIFASFNLAYGRIVAEPVIAAFGNPSPAKAAGLLVGDRIEAIDGAAITGFEQIREKVLPFPGETLAITVVRGSQHITMRVPVATRVEHDAYGNESRIGLIGIAAGMVHRVGVGPVQAITLAGGQCVGMLGNMVTGIRQIVVGKRSVQELGGPVKIAQYSGQRLVLGWQEFIYFAALISINLAFINLLPIPALDGGHLAFYLAEVVRRKPLGKSSQEWAFRTGLAFVLALMLFVTLNDLVSLRLFGH